jgi:general secretion pathway protein L
VRLSTLIVLMPPRDPAVHSQEWQLPELPFLLIDKTGRTQRAGRSALGLLPRATSTVLLIAARDLLMIPATVPPLKGPRLRQALPNVVEDHLIQDPQTCHFAIDAKPLADGRHVVAVIDRGWFRFLVEGFTAAGHRSLRAVPAEGVAATVAALAGDAPVTRYTLSAIPGEPTTRGSAANVAADVAAALPGAEPLPFETLARNALACRFDLCQFEFVVQPWRLDRATLRRLRVPIGLVAASLAVVVIGSNVEWLLMARQRDAINAQMTELLLNAFPKTTVVLDPPGQMARQLQQLRVAAGEPSPEDFLPLADGLARSLGPVPANAIASLDYRNRQLEVTFKPDATVDDDLAKRLARNGLQGSADPNTGKWTIRSAS